MSAEAAVRSRPLLIKTAVRHLPERVVCPSPMPLKHSAVPWSLEVQNRNRDPMAVLDHALYILAFGLAVAIAVVMLVIMN
jgi:hypothetical protein